MDAEGGWAEALLRALADPVFLVGPRGRLEGRNPAATTLGDAEWLADVFADREDAQHWLDHASGGAGEAVLVLRDGRRVLPAVVPVGERRAVVLRDVSRLLELREELAERRVAEAMRELARAVASELSDSVAVILGRADLLELIRPQDRAAGDARRHLEVLRTHARQILALCNALHAYGRVEGWHREPIAVSDLIERAMALCPSPSPDVAHDWDIEPGDLVVLGEPRALAQTLCILYGALGATLRRGRIRTRARPGGAFCNLEVMGETFLPTTRERGARLQGRPLGLTLAEAVLRASGGLVVQERTGEGWGIRIALPLAHPSAAPARAPSRGRVLLVEDDPVLSDVIASALASEGMLVDAHPSAEAALAALERADPPDLVISDLALPGRSGAAFLEDVVQEGRIPMERCLLISGLRRPPGWPGPYLQKPFALQELLHAVAGRLPEA